MWNGTFPKMYHRHLAPWCTKQETVQSVMFKWKLRRPREQDLTNRLRDNPEDIKAVLDLCSLLLADDRPVPLELQETSLRHYLARDPSRDDLAYRLSCILSETGRPVPAALEEQALRHCITLAPQRAEFYDRYASVVLEGRIAPLRNADTPPANADDLAIVSRAKQRLAADLAAPAVNDLPTYGIRWDEFSQRIRSAIAELDRPLAVVQFAQTHIGFEHRLPASETLRQFSLYERELRSEFPAFADRLTGFDDPPQSVPDTQIALEGRAISNIVPYLSRVVLSCLTHMPAPRMALELGGGYGAPARLWLNNPISPVETYVIVDISESLFFADVFLSATFGPENVYFVKDQELVDPAVAKNHRVILCPVPRLRSLENLPIDLIINTGSLQEMSEAWVSYYMKWLDRQNARYFYSLNYAAQPINHLAESINLWSPRPSTRWMARLLRWNPAFIRMQSERNFLESIYEKVDAKLEPQAAAERLSHLSERMMSSEVFIEYLDVFRRHPTPDLALSILRRAADEMPYQPKEALWLAEWLENAAGKDFLAAHGTEASQYRRKLAAARASGVEGTT